MSLRRTAGSLKRVSTAEVAWVPAYAGMTERDAGMTEGGAGMTEGGAGMTEGGAGMTNVALVWRRGAGMAVEGPGVTESAGAAEVRMGDRGVQDGWWRLAASHPPPNLPLGRGEG